MTGDFHLLVLGWDPHLIIKKKKKKISTVQSGLRTTEINNLIPKNSSKLWIQVNDQLQIYDFEDNQYILCHFYLLITKLNKFIGVYLIYKS